MFSKIIKETFIMFLTQLNQMVIVILLIWFPANLFISWYSIMKPEGLESLKIITKINEILYPLIVGTITYMTYCTKTGKKCNAFIALKKGFSLYWPIFKANIIAGLKMLIGLFLLLVPGLYFATKYALINPIVVVEGETDEKPRFVSDRMTKGNRWSIFFTGFIFIGGGIALSVGTEFLPKSDVNQTSVILDAINSSIFDLLACLSTIAMFLYYWHLKDNDNINEEQENGDEPEADTIRTLPNG